MIGNGQGGPAGGAEYAAGARASKQRARLAITLAFGSAALRQADRHVDQAQPCPSEQRVELLEPTDNSTAPALAVIADPDPAAATAIDAYR